MTRVKICGITRVEDAIAAVNAGAEYIGLIYSESTRRADYERSEEIIEAVEEVADIVGVFATERDLVEFSQKTEMVMDYYQVYFDGEEPRVRQPAKGWIRSYFVSDSDESVSMNGTKYMLCDFKNCGVGTRERILAPLVSEIQERIFVAGNLTSENVAEVVSVHRPFAVDCARGTEKSPGVKDIDLIKEFVRKVKDASA